MSEVKFLWSLAAMCALMLSPWLTMDVRVTTTLLEGSAQSPPVAMAGASSNSFAPTDAETAAQTKKLSRPQ